MSTANLLDNRFVSYAVTAEIRHVLLLCMCMRWQLSTRGVVTVTARPPSRDERRSGQHCCFLWRPLVPRLDRRRLLYVLDEMKFTRGEENKDLVPGQNGRFKTIKGVIFDSVAGRLTRDAFWRTFFAQIRAEMYQDARAPQPL